MSKITFLPEDLSGNIYIQASALQKCAKHLPPPTFGGMIANAIRQMSEYVKEQFIYHFFIHFVHTICFAVWVIYDVPFGRAGRRARFLL